MIKQHNEKRVFGKSLVEYKMNHQHLYPQFLNDIFYVLKESKDNFITPTSQKEIMMTINLIDKGTFIKNWNYSLGMEVLKIYLRSLPVPLIHPMKEYLSAFSPNGVLREETLEMIVHSKSEEIYSLQAQLFKTLFVVMKEKPSKVVEGLAKSMTMSLVWDVYEPVDGKMYDIVRCLIQNANKIYASDTSH